jgi:hypothetical protein
MLGFIVAAVAVIIIATAYRSPSWWVTLAVWGGVDAVWSACLLVAALTGRNANWKREFWPQAGRAVQLTLVYRKPSRSGRVMEAGRSRSRFATPRATGAPSKPRRPPPAAGSKPIASTRECSRTRRRSGRDDTP